MQNEARADRIDDVPPYSPAAAGRRPVGPAPVDAGEGRPPRGERGAAHRFLAFWLLATTPILALPGDRLVVRLLLLGLHLTVAAVLLHPGFHARAQQAGTGLAGGLYDWLPLLLAPAFYWEVPLLAGAIHGGVRFDAVVQAWEAAFFGGQPSRTLAARWPWLWLSEPLHAAYLSYYFFLLVPPVVLQWMGRREALREVIFTVVLVAIAHAAVFVVFPVLGPRYLFPAPAGGLETGPLYRLTHMVLEQGSSPGTAFPSSHVGEALAVTIALARVAPRVAPWAGLLAAALALGTVYGGFHYAVDALAGASLGGALALGAPVIRRRLARPQRASTANVSHDPGDPDS